MRVTKNLRFFITNSLLMMSMGIVAFHCWGRPLLKENIKIPITGLPQKTQKIVFTKTLVSIDYNGIECKFVDWHMWNISQFHPWFAVNNKPFSFSSLTVKMFAMAEMFFDYILIA